MEDWFAWVVVARGVSVELFSVLFAAAVPFAFQFRLGHVYMLIDLVVQNNSKYG